MLESVVGESGHIISSSFPNYFSLIGWHPHDPADDFRILELIRGQETDGVLAFTSDDYVHHWSSGLVSYYDQSRGHVFLYADSKEFIPHCVDPDESLLSSSNSTLTRKSI